MSDVKSLLPFNASPLEKALEQTLSRAADLPVPIDTLWNPWTCPEPLLPWLAWALSVDTWDSAWPVDVKRAFIAESVFIHRQKGTLGALRRALSGLGINVEVAEWFEYDGPPHTFRLTAWVNANTTPDSDTVLEPSLYRNLVRVVDHVKPVRSHYDFRVGIAFESTLIVGSAVFRAASARVAVTPEIHTGVEASLSVDSVITSASVIRVRATPTL